MAEEKKDKRQRGRYCVAGVHNKESCQNRSFTESLDMLFSFYNPIRRQERNESKQTFGTNVTSQLEIQHKTRPSPLTIFESKIAQL